MVITLAVLFIVEYIHNRNYRMKREANKGMVLYEEVLQKNFEIIETFLNKFPLIFKKQDFFEESIKKINEKLVKQEQDQQKIREQLQLTTSLLEKKIATSKENSARQSRNSSRISQQLIPLEERKNSIFKVGSGFKEPRDSHASQFSKEKSEMLVEVEKKQQEFTKRVDELDQTIEKMQERINFLSVLESKNEEKLDDLTEQKVNISAFDQLSNKFQQDFQGVLGKMVEEKYYLGAKLIDKKVAVMEVGLGRHVNTISNNLKNEMLGEIEKKAGVAEFREQLGEIRQVIEKMVVESVDSFAGKEETKKALLLFEKKFIKLELVLEEMLNEALKNDQEEGGMQCLTLPGRREKEVMTGFGRKRRIQK